MLKIRSILALMLMGALSACGSGEQDAEPASTAEVTASPAGGMGGMQGMAGMQMSGGMMEQMQAHVQMMESMSADSMMRMLPRHRQMVANMISQMNREMRDMNMTADQAWNSTIDAIRQDLVRLPEMGVQELEAFMPEHRERILSLMEMHRQMMQSMNR